MHPYLLHFGHLFIPTFGVLAAAGLMAALGLGERTARWAGVDPEKLWNAGLFAVLAAFVFSRLLLAIANWHALRAYPLIILAVPSLTPAGLLLTVVATLLWFHLRGIPVLPALDAWAPCATLVWCALALGHFAEASDPGLATDLPVGIRFPGESLALHPIALYAALLAAALTVALCLQLRRVHTPGRPAGTALVAAGVAQFLLSFLRQPGSETGGLDALQRVALGLIVAGALLLALPPAAASAVPSPDSAR